MSADVQKTAAAQAAQNIYVEEKGTQTEDIPRPLSSVVKIAEDALSRNGYHIKVSIKTDQKAVYVTERKTPPLPRSKSPAHGINTCCRFMRSPRMSPS